MTNYEINFLLVIIIIAFTVLRYVAKNGLFNVFAGVFAFVLASRFAIDNLIPLTVGLALLGVYLIYDGVWGRY